MIASSREIDITVVCPQPGMLNVLNRIKKWHLDDPLSKSNVRCVGKVRDLAEGMLAARGSPETSILVSIGYRGSEVHRLLNDEALRGLEIVVRPPRPSQGRELDDFPSASLLSHSRIVHVQDTLPALRKSLLRLVFKDKICVGELNTEDDFRQYFALRYRVWKNMGYLPLEQDCAESQWELNFTDRTAHSLGAFTRENVLIGCARLVLPLGQDSHHVRLIERMLAAAPDRKLAEVFRYPERLLHPYDLLACFDGFKEYFKRLIRRRIRSAEVSRVIVAPEYRAEGLGEVIVDSLLSLARLRQLQVLFLACHSRLKGFYERCGFYVLPGLECDHFAGVNAPAIAMAKKLTDEITLSEDTRWRLP
ncbi:MAG: GNAT family N-acetyltransferase [Gammaproteobacteria bacterium]